MSMSLDDYLRVWNAKPVLRLVYDDFYRRIAAVCRPGLTVELGGGIGNLKQRLEHVVSTDIQFASWLDCVTDAQRMPFADGSVDNIVMVDVLHHVEFPLRFFQEAERVLQIGGRIVMIEPAITWGSALFYRLLHHERVATAANPLASGSPDPMRSPYEANQAIPTLIATRDRTRFHEHFPRLKIRRVAWFSFLSYLLSGGFKPWSLMPLKFCPTLLRAEAAIEPIVGRFAALRMLLLIEKCEAGTDTGTTSSY